MSNPEFLPLLASPHCRYDRVDALAPLAWFAAASADAPILLVVPALGTPAGVYRRLAAEFAVAGVHVGVVELRGAGRSPVRARRGVDWGYADLVDGEIAHAYALARARHPLAPIHALGHSLGGHVLLLHQARRPEQPLASLALVASGTPYWRNYRGLGSLGVRLIGIAADLGSRCFGYYPGDLLRFAGRQGARLMREWAVLVREGRFAAVWPDGDWQERLHATRTRLLGISVPGDSFTPARTTEHLLRLAGVPQAVERLQVDGKPGHFGWLREPAPVVGRLRDWIGQAGNEAS